ncbi:hypothetical protein CONPUDRAFT_153469 [Coniophora puteana RWD-64-598 SS2]|uniref:Uncharacterized protein n=1 Tax=Coniophora puteana (strain RWD-64-598) TaxID=741705 RepID=A0A5M3MP40_CONPW|nr:uncharacterized protein CONPUDRAFT_153469 [Coniophora puteana RWD-64-598 SS2]EIW80929.1 hypothetical protein CONPUDRAFT_153469 [Coniophora puteana RWD-64-598 SS2]
MDSAELVEERSLYVGNALSCILYGFNLHAYFATVLALKNSKSRSVPRIFYNVFGGIMLLFVTCALVTSELRGQFAWIDQRGQSGGPEAYLQQNVTEWYVTISSVATLLADAMSNGLMMYRCYLIWGHSLRAVVLPFALFVPAVAISIVMTTTSAMPGASEYTGMPLKYDIIWMALTTAFNVVTTGTICFRIFQSYRQLRRMFPTQQHEAAFHPYTKSITIIVESSLLFTVVTVVYLVVQCIDSPVDIAIGAVWTNFCVLAPQLIILRIASGSAWTDPTTKENLSKLTTAISLDLEQSGASHYP